jgi:hypothetical protein
MTYTLLIQGPLNLTSLQAIEECNYHDQVDEIVVSHWSSDSLELKNKLYSVIDWVGPITVVETDLPDIEQTTNEGPQNNSTFWWSITSTYEGLKKCTSNATIKMRSDEYFSDFKELIHLFEKDQEKLVFANIFAKYWDDWRQHIGDHMFVAKTKRLQETYEWININYCKTCECLPWMKQNVSYHNVYPADGSSSFHYGVAENILASSYIYTLTKIEFENFVHDKNAFVSLFDIIDVNLLGSYSVKWAGKGIEWDSTVKTFDWPIKVMEDMMQDDIVKKSPLPY